MKTTTGIRYPQVKVKLIGNDGNAFSVLGNCSKQAKRAGLTQEQIEEFYKEATSGDYDNLLCVCMDYFDCD